MTLIYQFDTIGQFSILTENLASPRINYLLRSPDDQYVKNLKGELLRRPIPFGAPFLCIVKGIPDADQFDNYKLDGYVYETIGGNHRRLALQQILRDEGVQDVEKEKFKCVNVQLYAGESYLSVEGGSRHNCNSK